MEVYECIRRESNACLILVHKNAAVRLLQIG